MYQHLFEGRDPKDILGDLSEGVLACVSNAARLLDDATVLVTSGRYATATLITTTATEEIAKAYILLDACRLDLSRHHSVLKRLSRAFYDHISKHAYYAIHRFPRVISTDALRDLWRVETTRWWPRGDPESGEPDMPHETYFHRQLPLYVDFSDYSRSWITPNNDAYSLYFEQPGGFDRLQTTTEALDRFRRPERNRLFSPEVLEIVNRSLKDHYFNDNVSFLEIRRHYARMAENITRSTSALVEEVLQSPLSALPLYHFVAA